MSQCANQPGGDVNTYCYVHKGEQFWFQTPANMTMGLWEKLRRYLDSQKPEDSPRSSTEHADGG